MKRILAALSLALLLGCHGSVRDDQVKTCVALAQTEARDVREDIGRIQRCLIDKYQWTLADMDASRAFSIAKQAADSEVALAIRADSIQHALDVRRDSTANAPWSHEGDSLINVRWCRTEAARNAKDFCARYR
jgi:hypothetical protein